MGTPARLRSQSAACGKPSQPTKPLRGGFSGRKPSAHTLLFQHARSQSSEYTIKGGKIAFKSSQSSVPRNPEDSCVGNHHSLEIDLKGLQTDT